MSDSDSEDQPSDLYLLFRLGWRRVSARGVLCDHHPNIAFLRVCPSSIDSFLSPLRNLLPGPWMDWLECRYPEFFLPSTIVLKRQKLNWEEEFDNEKKIYQMLEPIQGESVPRLFGEAQCLDTGTRSLVLSNLGGLQLNEAPCLDISHLEDMLTKCLEAMAYLRVGHGDLKLDNFLLVGDKIMAIDFDTAYVMGDEEDPKVEVRFDVSHLSKYYQLIDWDDR